MFRLICATIIIFLIFSHSPVRTTEEVGQDTSRWMAQAKEGIARAAMKPEIIQSIAAHAMSQKLPGPKDASRGAAN